MAKTKNPTPIDKRPRTSARPTPRVRTRSRPLSPGRVERVASEPVAPPTREAPTHPTHEEIAEAAYQRYLSRGGGDGADFDDWLEAERELRTRNSRKLGRN